MKPTFPQTALNEDSTDIQFVFIGLSYHPYIPIGVPPWWKLIDLLNTLGSDRIGSDLPYSDRIGSDLQSVSIIMIRLCSYLMIRTRI